MLEVESISNVFRVVDAATVWQLVLLVLFTWLAIWSAQTVLPWIGNQLTGKRRLAVLMLVPFVRLALILLAFITGVPLLIEPTMQNMWAILGSVGIAIGFALKDYASSLIAGIVAIGERNYRTGDWVRIGDVYGEVRHVGMRTLEVVTPDDDRVLLPHSMLWGQPISNSNNGDARLQCVAEFYLHPDHDGFAVKALLEDVALTSPYLHASSPTVVVAMEKPWATLYRLKAYPLDASQQFRLITDLTLRGKSALTQADFLLAGAARFGDGVEVFS